MKRTTLLLISLLLTLISNAQFSTIARPDSVWVKLGDTISFNPTLNDVDTTGNPIVIDSVYSNDLEIIKFNDSTITFKMLDYGLNRFRIIYRVVDTTSIYNLGTQIYVFPDLQIDTIDANEIKAAIYPGSMQFYDILLHYGDIPYYERSPQIFYPKDSLSRTFFNYTIWFGGFNSEKDSLFLAAERYRQVGTDFWPGPLSIDGSVTTDSINAGKWMRTWKVSSDEIQYHLRNFSNPDYKMPEAIQSWPAHGNPDLNQAEFLAPFVDVDLDREYHPEKGDYPLIKGEQSIFFIFNDQLNHTESNGNPMGIEVHCMVWEFDEHTENVEQKSTLFYNYKFFNRSSVPYKDFYLGVWSDFDLGFAGDDYVGCNVNSGYYYVYNGREVDGAGEPHSYGLNPPTQATCILGGPFMDNDQFDNPDGECNESINGVGFGDGVVDNERLGLSYFLYHHNKSGTQGDPNYAEEYYNYLSGKWKDNTPMVYGGNAHYTTGGDSLFPTRFMFPGDSDPCNWGTNGLEPNWDTIWTEETTGNQYGDRRGLGSTGPFTFEAGSVEYLDIALVTAPGDQGRDSKELLEEYVEAIRAEYIKDPEEFGNQYLGAEELVFESYESISIYPNPTKGDHIYLELPQEKEAIYHIYNSTSQLVKQGFLLAQKQQEIDISALPSGWFVLEVIQDGKAYRTKLIR
jgi:hypothetical protein